MKKYKDFYNEINYNFNNINLLEEALTHPSLKDKDFNYQRLEFLGDAILSFIISDYLFKNFQNDNEGILSKKRSFLVSSKILYQIALDIKLDQYLIISKSEELNEGRKNKNILENSLESLIAAIYLDGGMDYVSKFILNNWQKYFIQLENKKIIDNPISKLQELFQKKFSQLPEYIYSKEGGSEHKPIFSCKIIFDNKIYKSLAGSKKDAQRKCADNLLKEIAN